MHKNFSTSNNKIVKLISHHVVEQESGKIAVLWYMKPIDGLPDPRGSLSCSIPSRVIAEVSNEVQEAMAGSSKRGPYSKYSAAIRAKIGKYSIGISCISTLLLTF